MYDISYLNKIFNELGALIGNKSLRDYTIDEDGYKRNLPEIYGRIYDVPVKKNLEDMRGIEFWDEEFNGHSTQMPHEKKLFGSISKMDEPSKASLLNMAYPKPQSLTGYVLIAKNAK